MKKLKYSVVAASIGATAFLGAMQKANASLVTYNTSASFSGSPFLSDPSVGSFGGVALSGNSTITLTTTFDNTRMQTITDANGTGDITTGTSLLTLSDGTSSHQWNYTGQIEISHLDHNLAFIYIPGFYAGDPASTVKDLIYFSSGNIGGDYSFPSPGVTGSLYLNDGNSPVSKFANSFSAQSNIAPVPEPSATGCLGGFMALSFLGISSLRSRFKKAGQNEINAA